MIHVNEEAARCLLYHNAPCGKAVSRALRAARFDNIYTAVPLFNSMAGEELLYFLHKKA